MSNLKIYTVTFSERIRGRTEVQATSEVEAEALAAKKFHSDCFTALEHMDTPSEILEFEGPDFVEFDVEGSDEHAVTSEGSR